MNRQRTHTHTSQFVPGLLNCIWSLTHFMPDSLTQIHRTIIILFSIYAPTMNVHIVHHMQVPLHRSLVYRTYIYDVFYLQFVQWQIKSERIWWVDIYWLWIMTICLSPARSLFTMWFIVLTQCRRAGQILGRLHNNWRRDILYKGTFSSNCLILHLRSWKSEDSVLYENLL